MQLNTNNGASTAYDYDATPPPTLTKGQKLVFWQAFLSRYVEYPVTDPQVRDEHLQMALGALHSILVDHPAEREMLNDVWECRDDVELLIEAAKAFNTASSKLLEYEKPREPSPWQSGVVHQTERGSNYRELRP